MALQRMFLAVRPPPAVRAGLSRLDRPAGPAVRWEDPANWHITIRFFPRAPLGEVIAAVDGLGPMAAPVVVLGPGVALLGGRAVIVPAAGLGELVDAVAGASRRFESAAGGAGRPFTGHLTLGRLRRGHGMSELVGQPFGDTFLADAVELVVSTPYSGGHRHEVAHRWGLTSSSAA